jgi:hypothetical protein
MAETLIRTTHTVGKCKTKGCKHKTRSNEGAFSAICPDHGRYLLDNVMAYEVPEIKCGGSCRNAVGPSCDCSCGGANHGHSHAH